MRLSFRALGGKPAYILTSLWCNSPSFHGFTLSGQIPLPMSLTVGHLEIPDKDNSCHEASFNISHVIQMYTYTRERPRLFHYS